MKIKTKRLIFSFLLCAGIVWNMICAVKMIPIHFYGLSGIAIAMCMILWLVVPDAAKGEKSNYIKDLAISEKSLAWVTLLLIIAWFITMLICVLEIL